jgi:Tol biopolymer transport system component
VVNDLNEYHTLSVTADGKSLVSIQTTAQSAVYLADVPAKLPAEIKVGSMPLTSAQADGLSLSWTRDGRLLTMDAQFHSAFLDPNTKAKTPFLEREPMVLQPTACGPDSIVVSLLHGKDYVGLSQYMTSTGELKALTKGPDDEGCSCSPDGKNVFFVRWEDGGNLMRYSMGAGTPVTMAGTLASSPSVSPDGKQVLFTQLVGQGSDQKLQFVTESVDGGQPLKVLPAPVTALNPRWTPDGKAIVYAKEAEPDGHALFYQSLDGGAPVQLTHFDAEPMALGVFAFSPDGKKIAITRARDNDSDLIMFSNFR